MFPTGYANFLQDYQILTFTLCFDWPVARHTPTGATTFWFVLNVFYQAGPYDTTTIDDVSISALLI